MMALASLIWRAQGRINVRLALRCFTLGRSPRPDQADRLCQCRGHAQASLQRPVLAGPRVKPKPTLDINAVAFHSELLPEPWGASRRRPGSSTPVGTDRISRE